jgi:Domain of unknown function (DUF5664)
MSKKFKVGDEVKIIKSIDCLETRFGQTGIVREIDTGEYGDYYRVVNPATFLYWWFTAEELELVPICNIVCNTYNGDLQNVQEIIQETEKNAQTSQNALGGIKYDQGKIRYTLLLQDLPRAVKEVTEVLEMGARKYSRMNFEKVESDRYKDAMLRHVLDYLKGQINDPESGKHHLAHLACCALFLIERELKEKELNNE